MDWNGSSLDFDLSVERRRIPIIPVFDDPAVGDLHETTPLDAECLSSRWHATGLAEEGAGHDPFAGCSFPGYRAMLYFHPEVREGFERPFKESLDGLASA